MGCSARPLDGVFEGVAIGLCLFRGAQLRAAGPRIALDLGLRRDDRPLGAYDDSGAAFRLECAQRVLDDAVLERMKADHRHAAARLETARSAAQKLIQSLELAVQPDADGLECPGRGIDARISSARDRAADDVGKLAGGRDRCARSRFRNCPGNAPPMAIFALLVNHVGERPLVRVADRVGRGRTGGRIHPHVERFVAPEAEPAARRIELHR